MNAFERLRARVERGLGWSDARWRPLAGGGLTAARRWLIDGPEETVFVKACRDAHSTRPLQLLER